MCSTVSGWLWHILHWSVVVCLMICLLQYLVFSAWSCTAVMSPSVSPLSPLCFIHLNNSSISIWSLSRYLGNLPCIAFLSPFVLDHILDIYLVLVFKLLGLPCNCLIDIYSTVWGILQLPLVQSEEPWSYGVWGLLGSGDHFLLVMYLYSSTNVTLYSRFMRDLPPSRHGRYILCTSVS